MLCLSTGDLVIRAYRPPDDAALARIDAAITTDPARLPLLLRAHAANGLWVAEQHGRLAGYIARTCDFFGKDFIALVVVDETLRRQGIGAELIRKMEEIARGDRIFTSTSESNAAMRAVLARLGFEPSGRIENLDPGDPELVFVKFLQR